VATTGCGRSRSGHLPADYYSYTLTVDGVRTLDPKNALIKQGTATVDNMVQVPGAAAEFQDHRTVPHGEVRKIFYNSSTMSQERRLHVYFPPGTTREVAVPGLLFAAWWLEMRIRAGARSSSAG
jgi:enterochelin esterase family protein